MRKKTVQTSSTKSNAKSNTKSNAKSNTKSNTKSNARNSVKSSVKSSAKNSPQKAVKTVAPTVENVSVKQAVIIQEPSVEQNIPTRQPDLGPRRSVAFIGSECYPFVKTCLEVGKNVVTSNKALVAAHGTELLAIAREKKVNFQFEASVGGGIPIIRPVKQCLAANHITELMGIFNGTTNFLSLIHI